MALIKCPECGEIVSDQAEICIHCGYPLKKNSEKQGSAKESKENTYDTTGQSTIKKKPSEAEIKAAEEKKKRTRNTIIGIVVVVAIIIVFVAVVEYRAHSSDRAAKRASEAISNYQSEKARLDELEREKSAVDAAIDAMESNK